MPANRDWWDLLWYNPPSYSQPQQHSRRLGTTFFGCSTWSYLLLTLRFRYSIPSSYVNSHYIASKDLKLIPNIMGSGAGDLPLDPSSYATQLPNVPSLSTNISTALPESHSQLSDTSETTSAILSKDSDCLAELAQGEVESTKIRRSHLRIVLFLSKAILGNTCNTSKTYQDTIPACETFLPLLSQIKASIPVLFVRSFMS